MKKTFTLDNPIDIDGVKVAELDYDFDEITIAGYSAAEAKAKRSTSGASYIAETDYTFQFYIACQAVIACNPKYDITDLERIHGADISKLVVAGRFFITQSDEQAEETSDEQSESIPKSTQPASQI